MKAFKLTKVLLLFYTVVYIYHLSTLGVWVNQAGKKRCSTVAPYKAQMLTGRHKGEGREEEGRKKGGRKEEKRKRRRGKE